MLDLQYLLDGIKNDTVSIYDLSRDKDRLFIDEMMPYDITLDKSYQVVSFERETIGDKYNYRITVLSYEKPWVLTDFSDPKVRDGFMDVYAKEQKTRKPYYFAKTKSGTYVLVEPSAEILRVQEFMKDGCIRNLCYRKGQEEFDESVDCSSQNVLAKVFAEPLKAFGLEDW